VIVSFLPRRNDMADVMKVLREERKMLSKRLSSLDNAIAALAGDVKRTVKKTAKRTMSAATRAKIAKAARARWAKIKKA
jgi:hypothetical protein